MGGRRSQRIRGYAQKLWAEEGRYPACSGACLAEAPVDLDRLWMGGGALSGESQLAVHMWMCLGLAGMSGIDVRGVQAGKAKVIPISAQLSTDRRDLSTCSGLVRS
jgi:hypothetical protein